MRSGGVSSRHIYAIAPQSADPSNPPHELKDLARMTPSHQPTPPSANRRLGPPRSTRLGRDGTAPGGVPGNPTSDRRAARIGAARIAAASIGAARLGAARIAAARAVLASSLFACGLLLGCGSQSDVGVAGQGSPDPWSTSNPGTHQIAERHSSGRAAPRDCDEWLTTDCKEPAHEHDVR